MANSEIIWSGAPWSCVKQLKHYRAFCRNGIAIALYSFVFVMGKGETSYLAYLEDLYEGKRGHKKLKVRWFHFSKEVKGVTLLRNPHQKEVFITSHVQEWIPAWKFAMPNKLGMRFSGRLTVRPIPPAADETEVMFDVGVAVDAWWSDGWWEGVVTGLKADSLNDTLQIYFPVM